jgi:hypothetical protein
MKSVPSIVRIDENEPTSLGPRASRPHSELRVGRPRSQGTALFHFA